MILIASLNQETFKINQSLVVIIQHIAVADLGIALFDSLSVLISLLANSWILGNTYCTATVYLAYYVNSVSPIMIVVLTTSKVLMLKYPLRAGSFTEKTSHMVCGFIWIICFTMPVLMFSLQQNNDLNFDFFLYICFYSFSNDVWKHILPATTTFIILLPNLIVFLTSIYLLRYIVLARNAAKRAKGNVRWQGALMVGLTALVYAISTLPMSVYAIAAKLTSRQAVWFHKDYYRVASSLVALNVISNFYIYLMTIEGFRRFVFPKRSSVVPSMIILTDVMKRTGKFCIID